jgi:hypothetical protein
MFNSEIIKIALVSIISSFITLGIAFLPLTNKPAAIQVLSVASLLYGITLSWLESGFLLLRNNKNLNKNSIYTIFVCNRLFFLFIIVIVYFFISYFFSILIDFYSFVLICFGMSIPPAVLSCTRSNFMNEFTYLFFLSFVVFALIIIYFFNFDAIFILKVYSLILIFFTYFPALLLSSFNFLPTFKYLFLKTKSFLLDLPITSAVENLDKFILSFVNDHTLLIAFNQLKVFFAFQREVVKYFKQLYLHIILEEQTKSIIKTFTNRYFYIAIFTQCFFLVIWFLFDDLLFNQLNQVHLYLSAVLISTSITISSFYIIFACRTFIKPNSLFHKANLISFSFYILFLFTIYFFSHLLNNLNLIIFLSLSYFFFYLLKFIILKIYIIK